MSRRVRLVLVLVGDPPALAQPPPGGGERRPGARRGARRRWTWAPASAGLLTSLPVLAFAVFGALAPAAARAARRRTGSTLAGAARASSSGWPAGPSCHAASRRSWRSRCWRWPGWRWPTCCSPRWSSCTSPTGSALVTALYTTALAVGLTAAFLLTVPVADALGGWRYGLGVWAVLAAGRGAPVARAGRAATSALDGAGARRRLRATSPAPGSGWAMALFFGLQSLQAYAVFGWFASCGATPASAPRRPARWSASSPAMSIPLSLWLPQAVARPGDQRWVLVLVIALLPGRLPRPDRRAARAGGAVGGGPRRRAGDLPAHPDPIGLRTRTAGGTAALSGFTQSTGYLMAGDRAVRRRRAARGDRRLDRAAAGAARAQRAAVRWSALYVGRPAHIEDQLRARRHRPSSATERHRRAGHVERCSRAPTTAAPEGDPMTTPQNPGDGDTPQDPPTRRTPTARRRRRRRPPPQRRRRPPRHRRRRPDDPPTPGRAAAVRRPGRRRRRAVRPARRTPQPAYGQPAVPGQPGYGAAGSPRRRANDEPGKGMAITALIASFLGCTCSAR